MPQEHNTAGHSPADRTRAGRIAERRAAHTVAALEAARTAGAGQTAAPGFGHRPGFAARQNLAALQVAAAAGAAGSCGLRPWMRLSEYECIARVNIPY